MLRAESADCYSRILGCSQRSKGTEPTPSKTDAPRGLAELRVAPALGRSRSVRAPRRHFRPELRGLMVCYTWGSFPRPPNHCYEPEKICTWNRGGGTIASLMSCTVRFGFTSLNRTSCNDNMLFSGAAIRRKDSQSLR